MLLLLYLHVGPTLLIRVILETVVGWRAFSLAGFSPHIVLLVLFRIMYHLLCKLKDQNTLLQQLLVKRFIYTM